MQIRRIETVHAIPGTLTLLVRWKDGVEDTVDMTQVIRRSASLHHLEDPSLFSKVDVIDWGCAVGWHNDLGYGADTLYEQVLLQSMKAAG
ncbi:MAG: hypothetical protein HW380_1437 [Magnetococcales bacterium]|nr:hypothetical protein [Magnetococcales bacterium]HIJ83382.1 DUF2442 domain-containing protein [Magnetococcales bacterium]